MVTIPGYCIERVLSQEDDCRKILAKRSTDDLKVVIKLPKAGLKNTISFFEEYEIAREFDHENIIQYIDLIQINGYQGLVHEYFKAEPLGTCIPAKGFDPDSFLALAVQIAEGLSEIHDHGIVHQYINPKSIFINEQKTHVKIGRFSHSTYNTHLTKSDIAGFAGVLPYISPEQTGRMNRYIDYRTDFYSLGIIFYHMLTGKLPFSSDDSLEMIHWHIAREAGPLNSVKETIPDLLSQIVLKLLSKNTSDRYQSAGGVLSDLRMYQENDLSPAGPESAEKTAVGLNDYSNTFSIPQRLYGREPELTLLSKRFDQVVKGDTVAVMVTGYSGIGKSAVVNELQEKIMMGNAYFGAGKYEHQKKNVSYSAIALVFQNLIRQILGESDERIRLWQSKLLTAVGENGQLILDIIPELAMIIGKQKPVAKLGAAQSQNRFNNVFQRFVSVFDQLAHPLVIFLDDLQWIDLASLSLIRLLISEHLTKSFLFIGAYRSNEVDESHPVATTMKNIENTGVKIEYVHLPPLGSDSINAWVSDTLKRTLKSTKKLSELVKEKTDGNPFFIKSFLNNLYAEQFIRFSPDLCWEWETQEIIKVMPTDNVMELMVNNLKKLPGDSCALVSLASCLGTDFSQDVLSIVSGESLHDVAKKMKPVLAAGMLIRQHREYRFVHDKILEGAYSIIPPEDKPKIHLETGRLLVKHLNQQELEADLFNIVEHLNKGLALIQKDDEIEKVRGLNLKAAQKALNSSAYKSAGYYFNRACGLMPDNSWQKDYSKTLEIYSQWAEAEYMSSNFEKAESLFNLILEHAVTLLDKCRIYQMILVYNENQKRFREAVDLSVTVMNELGIAYPHPRTITPKDIETQKKRLFKNINNRSVHTLIETPVINDPVQEAAIGIMVSVLVPYWNTYPEALAFHSYEVVNRSLEIGMDSKASIAFSMVGSILIEEKETADIGYEMASLAIAITERFEDSYYGTAAIYMFYNHVVFWKKPLRWGLENLIHAFHTGIETGNIQWASYCLNHYSMRLLMAGDRLDSVKEVYDKYTGVMYRLKQNAPLTFFNPPRQAVDNLLGLARDNTLLKGEAFDEETGIASFYETKQFPAIGLAYIFKLMVYIIFGAYKKAHELVRVDDCELFIRAGTSQFQPYIGLCFFGLALTRNYGRVSKETQRQYLEKTGDLIKEFRGYAEKNSRNFAMMYHLLLAERFQITDQLTMAMESYEKSMEVSRDNGYLYFEALANELCATAWQAKGKTKIANGYFHDAFQAYEKWGCIPKLKQMEAAHSFLSSRTEGETDAPGRESESIDLFDINSVQKATLAISSQIHPDKVLEQLIRIIIENAGARRGSIILDTAKGLIVEAGFDVEGPAEKNVYHREMEDTGLVPENIIRYVIRTGEKIILSDAGSQGDYVNLPYVKTNRSRSILSMPIIFKNKIQGALFLENSLAADVFSEQRIELLSIILSQAAISLENARLFQESMDHQKELSQLRNYLANIIDSISSMLIGVDRNGFITQWNSQAVLKTGVEVDDALGKPFHKIVPGMAAEMDKIREAVKAGREIRNLRRVYYHDGERRFEDISIFPLRADNAQGAVIRIDDITERVRMEEVMIQSEKMLSVGGLAAGMAHEINNPLGGMMQTADVIRHRLTNLDIPANIKAAKKAGCSMDEIRDYMEDRSIPEMLGRIGESGKRAAEIVQNMLSFARKGETSRTNWNMAILIEECIKLADVDYDLKKKYDFRQFEIKRDFQPGLPEIPCDPGKIKQVVMNLLRNSAEAMLANSGKKPTIALRLGRNEEEDMLDIEVEDNGPGMDEKVRKRVFEPFFTTKPTDQGTGLGLSVSFFIITEDHGGRMRVESEQGQGTRFIISLPFG